MSAEDSATGVRHPSVRARGVTERLLAVAVIGVVYLVVGVALVVVVR